MAIATLVMLREPEIKKKKRPSLNESPHHFDTESYDHSLEHQRTPTQISESTDNCIDMTNSEKVKYLTGKVIELVKSDIKYPLCFLGVMVTKLVTILYSIYLMLWMTSFVETGMIDSEERVKTLYSEVLTGAMIGTLFALPIIGKIADTAPISVFMPVAFLLRGIIACQFSRLHDPESTLSILMSMLIIIASAIQYISVEVLFLRSLPNEIRGTMIGLNNFFGLLGQTIFSVIAGIIFDKIGPASPFTLVAFCDFTIAAIAVTIAFFGLLRQS